MIFQYSTLDEPIIILLIVLTITLIVGAILTGLYAFIASKNPENKMSANYLIGIGMFCMLFALGRILFFTSNFIPGFLDITVWKIATIAILAGLICIVYCIETFIYKKTKHIFTIIGIVLAVLIAVTPEGITEDLSKAANVVMAVPPFLIYVSILIKSVGDVRKKTATILIGLTIFTLGNAASLLVLAGILDPISQQIFEPPVILIGLVITSYGLISMAR
jgi:hypothetical protein